ncbi:MAG: hypothetical protein PHR36_01355 [Patescibacteria group bacterium]|nr:hypothetical protein [Patescibacteria group bacterium]
MKARMIVGIFLSLLLLFVSGCKVPFSSFLLSKKTVEVEIDGSLRDAVFSPTSVPAKKGKFVLIEVKGQVFKDIIGLKPKLVPLSDVVGVSIPGQGKLGLNQGLSETQVMEDGEIEFFVPKLSIPGTKYATGTQKGKKEFKKGKGEIIVKFSDKPFRKGKPLPQKVWTTKFLKDLGVRIPSLEELKELMPDEAEFNKTLDQIRKESGAYMDSSGVRAKVDSLQKKIQEGEKALKSGAAKGWNYWFNDPVREIPPKGLREE